MTKRQKQVIARKLKDAIEDYAYYKSKSNEYAKDDSNDETFQFAMDKYDEAIEDIDALLELLTMNDDKE